MSNQTRRLLVEIIARLRYMSDHNSVHSIPDFWPYMLIPIIAVPLAFGLAMAVAAVAGFNS